MEDIENFFMRAVPPITYKGAQKMPINTSRVFAFEFISSLVQLIVERFLYLNIDKKSRKTIGREVEMLSESVGLFYHYKCLAVRHISPISLQYTSLRQCIRWAVNGKV